MSNNPGRNENSDQIYCRSISKSISDVIRFSPDEDFRKHSFELFGVSCTVDTEKEIYKKLMKLVENKNCNLKGDPEDKEYMEVEPPDPIPHTDAEKVIEAQSKDTKRSWLQISSQQHRESVKCKRTCFYSQPEFREGFFNGNSYQASHEMSTALRDSNSYCKEKFTKLFNVSSISNMRHFSQ